MSRCSSRLLFVVACACLSALVGCPEAREPVVQVQAAALPKAVFDGEWYFQRTVIDMPYETEFTFVGDQGELDRIRWRIEENLLVAVRSYERIEGSDPDRNADGRIEGSPVAAWPIVEHFDIRRDYNPTTGEEGNVIVENSSDRQWHEREYMRVDWTSNVITNWNFYAQEIVNLEPMAVAFTDPTHENAPIITPEYLEVTSAFIAEPISAVDPDWPEDGAIPLCWYFYHFDDCTAAEVTVRNSFLKVDDRDYEPVPWTGRDMELFGFFDVQRWSYDEQYGQTNTGRRRFQGTWNLWDAVHDGRACEEPAEGEEDACADVVGSHCSPEVGQCTLPYRDRPVRRIAYHTNPGLDPRLSAVAEEAIDQWNVAFRDTVNALRYYECLDDGGDEVSCETERLEDLEVLVWCPNNPVQSGDPAACGPAGTAPRLGDLRYNFIWSDPRPSRGAPFGFGPAQLDPVTGEVISAAAIVYEAPIRAYAAHARDIVQLINGEIDVDEYVLGETVSDWVEARRAELEVQPLTREQAEDLMDDVQLHHERLIPPSAPPAGRRPSAAARAKRQARDRMADFAPTSHDGSRVQARLDALIDSPIERLLVDDEVLLSHGRLPGTALTDEVVAAVSPLRQLRDQRRRVAFERRMKRNATRCAYHRQFVDPSVQGRAESFAGMDPEEIRWELMLGVYRGVVAHELGHTFGLRHNLKGSADPFNFPARYWELRDDGDMAPRYLDPETEDERDGFIREYQTSAVMDYLSRFNSDSHGVHSYDRAAIKYGYGRLLEVVDDAFSTYEQAWRTNELYMSQLWGDTVGLFYDWDSGDLIGMHYTDYWDEMGEITARRDVPTRLLSDFYGEAAWWDSPHTYLADENGYPVAPYKFCSDEFVGSDIDCLYFDEGADLYEIPHDLIGRWERDYIFNNFARDAMYFTPDGHVWWIWDAFFDPLISLNQWWVLDTQWLISILGPDEAEPFIHSDGGYGPMTMGVREAFNMFARAIARPTPGDYALREDPEGILSWREDTYADDASLTVGLEDGRYLDTAWDYDEGYFWDEAVQRIGFMAEKSLAMEALMDPTTYFLGQDTSSDLRRYRVNFASNFFPQLMDLVGAVVTGDRAAFSPYELDDAITFPDYADLDRVLPAGAIPVDPAADFTVQLNAIVRALSLLPDTYDSELIDSSRIWFEGGPFGIDTSRPTVSHNDPGSGITWVAASYEDGAGEEKGIAARMILRAERLAAILADLQADIAGGDDSAETARAAAEVELELGVQRENLNILRSVHIELGTLGY